MHMHADFTSTSELPFASLERVLMLNVSHENDLIFMQLNIKVTYIFIPIVLHKDLFCYRGKSKLGIGLFIHELHREPLIKTSKEQLQIAVDMDRHGSNPLGEEYCHLDGHHKRCAGFKTITLWMYHPFL